MVSGLDFDVIRSSSFPYFGSCSMKTSLANDFTVVRLNKKGRELFITGLFPAREIIFITVLKQFKKIAVGENYSHYSFILIQKQKGGNCNHLAIDGITDARQSMTLKKPLLLSTRDLELLAEPQGSQPQPSQGLAW